MASLEWAKSLTGKLRSSLSSLVMPCSVASGPRMSGSSLVAGECSVELYSTGGRVRQVLEGVSVFDAPRM